MEIRKDYITALVDGEAIEESILKELKEKIANDKSLEIDYKVQLLIKNLVKEKIEFKQTPARVKRKILRSIGSTTKVTGSSTGIAGIFEKPAFSFATVLVIIFAIILIVLNRPALFDKKDFAVEQSGSSNMFIQAENNFNSIIQGKLTPQFTSSNADEIKNFFSSNGVKYSTSVPELKDWQLLGAVVSEDKGEKFAHHVYTNQSGKIAYIFQVDESYFSKSSIITLSDDLISYLDEGNCYSTYSDNSVKLFTKTGNNIFAIVSNADPDEIKNDFCRLN